MKKQGWIGLILVVVFGAFSVFYHIAISEEDQALYRHLTEKAKHLRESQALERHPSHQERESVEKDFWRVVDGERSHFHLHSDHSTLSLKQKKNETEAVENMERITCSSDQKEVKLFAKQGRYDYPDLQMFAEEVECVHALGSLQAGSASLESFDEQTLALQDHVLFTPSATSVPVKISSQDALCHWDCGEIEFLKNVEIQMERREQECTVQGDFALYQESLLTLYPDEGGLCHLLRGMDRMSAQEIAFDLAKEEIRCVNATGQLQSIQNKDSFLIADLVVYTVGEDVLTLSSEAPHRVLFWQDGFRLSAPQVIITKDPVTAQDKVCGKGDVHFTFTVEEQNMIEQLISKYL